MARASVPAGPRSGYRACGHEAGAAGRKLAETPPDLAGELRMGPLLGRTRRERMDVASLNRNHGRRGSANAGRPDRNASDMPLFLRTVVSEALLTHVKGSTAGPYGRFGPVGPKKGKAPAVRRERKRDYAGACSAINRLSCTFTVRLTDCCTRPAKGGSQKFWQNSSEIFAGPDISATAAHSAQGRGPTQVLSAAESRFRAKYPRGGFLSPFSLSDRGLPARAGDPPRARLPNRRFEHTSAHEMATSITDAVTARLKRSSQQTGNVCRPSSVMYGPEQFEDNGLGGLRLRLHGRT